ncbi:MAG TPA: DUF58 domain-containing protein [Candidatus Scybalocola faecavium]|nr:DUF58 domain-containing protein [Candidatus Scybalocola faecavium]
MNILFAALAIFILYLIQRWLYEHMWNRNLSAKITYSRDTAVEGDEAALIEVVTNNKKLPLPALTVKFQTSRKLLFHDRQNSAVTDQYYRNDIFSMGSREKITRTLPFTCTHRGYYTIDQMALTCTDLLYIEKFSQIQDTFTQLYVYPKYVDIRRLLIPFNQLYGSLLTRRRYLEDPFEFRGIREYQPFDSMRSINWKAYARTKELKVNLYEYTASQEVCIFLDLENFGYANHYDIMEENIRLSATLSDMFISKGIPVSLKTNGCDCTSSLPVCVDAGTGASHQTRMLQSLARIDLAIPVKHLAFIIGDTLGNGGQPPCMIFISNRCYEDLMDLLSGIFSENDGCCLICTGHKEMFKEFTLPDLVREKTILWEVEHID